MNLKFHLIISSVFLLLILGALLAYDLTQPRKGDDKGIMEDRFIQISDATWGENCNGYIKAVREQAKQRSSSEPVPELVRKNNVLRTVSSYCNGHEICDIPAVASSFNVEAIPACDKILSVEYRCFVIDRVHKVTAEEGRTLTINCRG